MQFWNNFAAKHPAAAKWVREGGLFVVVSNLITVFKYLLLQFLPKAFASLPVVDFGWPGIPVTLFGETFQWNILGTAISTPQVGADYKNTGINNDSAIITLGNSADSDYATYLADIIAAGKLPFALENVKMESVGASLGEKSLSSSLTAGAIGIALVILFMIIVYRLPGVIASVALLLYTTLFLVVVAIAKLNLSLPGIAGVILTLGMAVDANVITFEQIKEQIRGGKTIRAAIDTGYKNAMSAIIDSNVTTIIAAVVLWRLGTGSTVGFAKTLFIGVVLSMIVMLFASQIMMKALVGVKAVNPALYGVKKQKEEK